MVIPEAVDLAKGCLPDGEETEDFNYFNKNYMFTLNNVCATQELHRIITRQQVVIDDDSLISRIEALET